jgi:hypothetical protein
MVKKKEKFEELIRVILFLIGDFSLFLGIILIFKNNFLGGLILGIMGLLIGIFTEISFSYTKW